MEVKSDPPKKILLVDDHPITRLGLVLTFDAAPDLEVVGTAGTAEEALKLLERARPDLLVADLSLPGMSGLQLIRRVRVQWPGLRLLVVTRHAAPICVERALRAGAQGYVLKHEKSEAIVEAARYVLGGGLYISPALRDAVLLDLATLGDRPALPPEVLSERELEVFEMIGNGVGTREIAEHRGLSVKTVESYRQRIKGKLGLGSAPELMREAVKWVAGVETC